MTATIQQMLHPHYQKGLDSIQDITPNEKEILRRTMLRWKPPKPRSAMNTIAFLGELLLLLLFGIAVLAPGLLSFRPEPILNLCWWLCLVLGGAGGLLLTLALLGHLLGTKERLEERRETYFTRGFIPYLFGKSTLRYKMLPVWAAILAMGGYWVVATLAIYSWAVLNILHHSTTQAVRKVLKELSELNERDADGARFTEARVR